MDYATSTDSEKKPYNHMHSFSMSTTSGLNENTFVTKINAVICFYHDNCLVVVFRLQVTQNYGIIPTSCTGTFLPREVNIFQFWHLKRKFLNLSYIACYIFNKLGRSLSSIQ